MKSARERLVSFSSGFCKMDVDCVQTHGDVVLSLDCGTLGPLPDANRAKGNTWQAAHSDNGG